ncbi:hypothetical protein ACET3X_006890 [Alternaria dauci]|uniref:Uncharacterized protein n=1 Tax=Alternaria dauci TaxID=48095 RepID=A0ABR3UGW1_9PLEO
MSSTRNTTLREMTHSFCRALISPPAPADLLSQYFSDAPKITEHGPEWSRSRLPFLAKTFSGRDGCEEYFKVMTDVLDMSLPEDAFPGKEGFIVDAEAGMYYVSEGYEIISQRLERNKCRCTKHKRDAMFTR